MNAGQRRPADHRITVLQIVSHAAGAAKRRSTSGPERRALAALDHWDYEQFRIVLTYAPAGRLYEDFRRAAADNPALTLVPLVPPRRRDWRALQRISRMIRTHGVDVVHTQGAHGTDWWAALAARMTGVRSIVTRPVALCDYDLPPLTFHRFRLTDRMALRRCHAMVFVSDAVRARSIACGEAVASRSRVIRNGVDLHRFTPVATATGTPPVFGMIGQLLPVKDWNTFLNVATRVFAAIPDSRALIVGDGPERERLERDIAHRGLADRIRLVGFLSDVTRALAAMDVFALTSRREGLPVAIAEAMAVGRPVVATDVGGVREMVLHGETGFLASAGDAEALASGIVRLLRDPALRGRFGRAGRLVAERRFSLEAMVTAYGDLYREAATRHPSRWPPPPSGVTPHPRPPVSASIPTDGGSPPAGRSSGDNPVRSGSG